jgi:hypothetical protein
MLPLAHPELDAIFKRILEECDQCQMNPRAVAILIEAQPDEPRSAMTIGG